MSFYGNFYTNKKFWSSILSHYLAFLLCVSLSKWLVVLGISFLEGDLPSYTTTIQWHKFIIRVFFGTLLTYMPLTGIFLFFFVSSLLGKLKILLFSLESWIILTTVLGFLFVKDYGYLPEYREILFLKHIQPKELLTIGLPFSEIFLASILSIVFLVWTQKKLEKSFDKNPRKKVWVFLSLVPVLIVPFAIYQFKLESLGVFSIELLQKDPSLHVLSSYIEYQKSRSELNDFQNLNVQKSHFYDPKKFRNPKDAFLLREEKKYTFPSKQVIQEPKKYNVVFFLLESMPPFVAGKKIHGKTVAPKLKKLMEDSLNFERVFASGMNSIEGQEAIYYSTYPPIMDMNNQKVQNNLSFVHILEKEGYHTSAMTSMKGNWFLGEWALNLIGHRNFYGLEDYKKESQEHFNRVENSVIYQAHNRVRSSDHFLLESLDKHIKQYSSKQQSLQQSLLKEPFFITFTSSSNHAPYKPYPENSPVKKLIPDPSETYEFFLNTYHYTGEIIAEWIEKSKNEPFFQNTLFVLVSDHKPMSLDLRKIPFLKDLNSFEQNLSLFTIYNPNIIRKNLVTESIEKRRGSHIDIGPTLLNLLGIQEGRTFFLGQSLVQDEFYSDRMVPMPRAHAILYQDYSIFGDEVSRLDLVLITKQKKKEIFEKAESFRKDLKIYEKYYRNILTHQYRAVFQNKDK